MSQHLVHVHSFVRISVEQVYNESLCLFRDRRGSGEDHL